VSILPHDAQALLELFCVYLNKLVETFAWHMTCLERMTCFICPWRL